jgi:general secretion pathway protein G
MNRKMRGRQSRGGNRRGGGFTIVEVLVIVVIIGVIAALIAPRLFQRIGQSKQATAAANAATLANSMNVFILDHGMPPSGSPITILWERPSWVAEEKWRETGPYVNNPDALLDPWGNPYILVIPGQRNVDFDIVSYGADGQPGGEGESADIIKP